MVGASKLRSVSAPSCICWEDLVIASGSSQWSEPRAGPQNLRLQDYPETIRSQISAKVEAFERFINLNALALGLLQVLALEMPKTIWQHFPLWFRSLPKHGYPSERIVRLALQNQLEINFSRSRPALLLDKLLRAKIRPSQVHDNSDLAAWSQLQNTKKTYYCPVG